MYCEQARRAKGKGERVKGIVSRWKAEREARKRENAKGAEEKKKRKKSKEEARKRDKLERAAEGGKRETKTKVEQAETDGSTEEQQMHKEQKNKPSKLAGVVAAPGKKVASAFRYVVERATAGGEIDRLSELVATLHARLKDEKHNTEVARATSAVDAEAKSAARRATAEAERQMRQARKEQQSLRAEVQGVRSEAAESEGVHQAEMRAVRERLAGSQGEVRVDVHACDCSSKLLYFGA